MKTNEDQILIDKGQVRIKAYAVKKALDAFAVYVTNPGMEDELMATRQQIEEIEKEILKDLSDPDWEYR